MTREEAVDFCENAKHTATAGSVDNLDNMLKIMLSPSQMYKRKMAQAKAEAKMHALGLRSAADLAPQEEEAGTPIIQRLTPSAKAKIQNLQKEFLDRRTRVSVPADFGGIEDPSTIEANQLSGAADYFKPKMKKIEEVLPEELELVEEMGVQCVLVYGVPIPMTDHIKVKNEVKQRLIEEDEARQLAEELREKEKNQRFSAFAKSPSSPRSPTSPTLLLNPGSRKYLTTPRGSDPKRGILSPRLEHPVGLNWHPVRENREIRNPLYRFTSLIRRRQNFPWARPKCLTAIEAFEPQDNLQERNENANSMGQVNEKPDRNKKKKQKGRGDDLPVATPKPSKNDADESAEWF